MKRPGKPTLFSMTSWIFCTVIIVATGCQYKARESDVIQAAKVSIRDYLDEKELDEVQVGQVTVEDIGDGKYEGRVVLTDQHQRTHDQPFHGAILDDQSFGIALPLPQLPYLESRVRQPIENGLKEREGAAFTVNDVLLQLLTGTESRFTGLAAVTGPEGPDRCHIELTLEEDGQFELKFRLVKLRQLKETVHESLREQFSNQGLEEFELEIGDLACNSRGELWFSGSLVGKDQKENPVRIGVDWLGDDNYRVSWGFAKGNQEKDSKANDIEEPDSKKPESPQG